MSWKIKADVAEGQKVAGSSFLSLVLSHISSFNCPVGSRLKNSVCVMCYIKRSQFKISFYCWSKDRGATACSCSGILSTVQRGQRYMFTFMSRTRSLTARSHLVTACMCVSECVCVCVCGDKGSGGFVWELVYDWRHLNNSSLPSLTPISLSLRVSLSLSLSISTPPFLLHLPCLSLLLVAARGSGPENSHRETNPHLHITALFHVCHDRIN